MYRNSEQHFAAVPSADIPRSKFDLSTNHKTTLNVGDIVPLYVNTDITPGDTFQVNESMVLRMQTPTAPVLDNIWIDTYWFFTPHRIVWDHWKEFMGENKTGAWYSATEYTCPITKLTGSDKIAKGTMLDYFGLQTDATRIWFDSFAQRSYVKIYNDWFRNQSLIAPITELTGDSDTTYAYGTINTGGGLCKASKVSSYLTTCLPAPQKGDAVTLPLGTTAPVYGDGKGLFMQYNEGSLGVSAGSLATYATADGQPNGNLGVANYYSLNQDIGETGASFNSNGNGRIVGVGTKSEIEKYNNAQTPIGNATSGIYADLTNATAATINALRIAMQTQKILERDARGGTRYAEVLLSHYGVKNPMFDVLQMPEYLGGGRTPITISQVTSSVETSDAPLGYTGAVSVTGNSKRAFTKSFTEHGTLMCVGVIRYSHSYQQKIHRMWRRQRRLDFYWPELAHIGEQPVYNYEIYAQGDSITDASGNIVDNQVFGYQERFGEMRYGDDIITGEMRSTYATPLDTWHYGDKYNSLPVLSQNWIEEDPQFVSRTIAVQNQDQFFGDFYFDIKAWRGMPAYGTPGYVDHF